MTSFDLRKVNLYHIFKDLWKVVRFPADFQLIACPESGLQMLRLSVSNLDLVP